MSRVNPLIRPPAMFDHPNYVGSCDWGGCHEPATAMRWETNRRRYLAVCGNHERGRGGPGLPVQPKEPT